MFSKKFVIKKEKYIKIKPKNTLKNVNSVPFRRVFGEIKRIDNVFLDYSIHLDTMILFQLKNISKVKKFSQVLNVWEKIEALAKKNNVKKIQCVTWIFLEKPLIAKKLGFILTPGNDRVYNQVLKENNTKKVIGVDFSEKQKCEMGSLVIKTKNNETKLISLDKIVPLPIFTKYIE